MIGDRGRGLYQGPQVEIVLRTWKVLPRADIKDPVSKLTMVYGNVQALVS